MAIESALKALLLQKTGAYPFKHKLNELFDAAEPAGLDFDQRRFDGWPRQKEMSALRYPPTADVDMADAHAFNVSDFLSAFRCLDSVQDYWFMTSTPS